MYVYTETGILLDRIKYDEIANKCGRPESISENGSHILFCKCNCSADIHLVDVNVQGLKVTGSINLKKRIEQYISEELDK